MLWGSNTPVWAASEKPNILMIMVDNLGYGELGAYGGGVLRGAPTPRIDKLAAEGMRLTNFNVEPQCTPSRSALMTGRQAGRHLADTRDLLPLDRDTGPPGASFSFSVLGGPHISKQRYNH